MKLELSKKDIEIAIKNYVDMWFPAVKVVDMEVVRSKKVEDIKYIINVEEKGE